MRSNLVLVINSFICSIVFIFIERCLFFIFTGRGLKNYYTYFLYFFLVTAFVDFFLNAHTWPDVIIVAIMVVLVPLSWVLEVFSLWKTLTKTKKILAVFHCLFLAALLITPVALFLWFLLSGFTPVTR